MSSGKTCRIPHQCFWDLIDLWNMILNGGLGAFPNHNVNLYWFGRIWSIYNMMYPKHSRMLTGIATVLALHWRGGGTFLVGQSNIFVSITLSSWYSDWVPILCLIMISLTPSFCRIIGLSLSQSVPQIHGPKFCLIFHQNVF